MGFLNLMWNPKFIKTRAGMTMTAQCAVGFLGGFFALFCCVLNGFESFLLWGAFFGSGFFLFTHVANLTQVLEARFPYLVRIVSLLFSFQTLIWPSLWSAPWVYLPLVRSSGNHVHLEIGLCWRLSGEQLTISHCHQHDPLHGFFPPFRCLIGSFSLHLHLIWRSSITDSSKESNTGNMTLEFSQDFVS